MSLRIRGQGVRRVIATAGLVGAGFLMQLLCHDSINPAFAKASHSDLRLVLLLPAPPDNSIVLQTDHADVTGDGVADTIQLIGTKSVQGSGLYSKLTIEVQDNVSHKKIYFYGNGGYAPLLGLCDVNGDRVSDLYLTSTDPRNGEVFYPAFYTIAGDGSQSITHAEPPKPLTVTGKLKDNYKVQITIRNTNQSYMLDRREHRFTYDQAGFYQNGRLLKPKKVTVATGYNGLRLVDFDKDGTCELRGIQHISGIAEEDTIAYAVSMWKWRYQQWTLMRAELLSPSELPKD